MVLAEKPLSMNRGRPNPRYTQRIQAAAMRYGVRLQMGALYARIVWFQRRRAQGDVDNIAKLILDSLKGVIISDDDEITRCLVQKTVANQSGEYEYDTSLIPSVQVLTDLPPLLGTAEHVLYIEVGVESDATVTFGPVI
jgi:hypothetical protein